MNDNIGINPDSDIKYGQSVPVDGSCYIKTGRKTTGTKFMSDKLVASDLTDEHTCVCDSFFAFDACDPSVTLFSTSIGTTNNIFGSWPTTFNSFSMNETQIRSITPDSHVLGPTSEAFEPSDQFAFMIWFNPIEDLSAGSPQINLWEQSETNSDGKFGINISISSNHTNNDGSLSVITGGDQWKLHTTNVTQWSKDKWYHVAVVRNNNLLSVYLNAELHGLFNCGQFPVMELPAKMTHGDSSKPIPLNINSFKYYTSVIDIEDKINTDYTRLIRERPPEPEPTAQEDITVPAPQSVKVSLKHLFNVDDLVIHSNNPDFPLPDNYRDDFINALNYWDSAVWYPEYITSMINRRDQQIALNVYLEDPLFPVDSNVQKWNNDTQSWEQEDHLPEQTMARAGATSGCCNVDGQLVWGKFFPTSGRVRINKRYFDNGDFAKTDHQNQTEFYHTIRHEICHILGISSTFFLDLVGSPIGQYTEDGQVKYYFHGENATKQYKSYIEDDQLRSGIVGIPLEDSGGSSTAGGHWEEGDNERYINGNLHPALDTEMMTGYAESDTAYSPVSRMTLGALHDIGWVVDYTKAEPYSLDGSVTEETPATVETTDNDKPQLISIKNIPEDVEPGDFLSIDGARYINTGKTRIAAANPGVVEKTTSCGSAVDLSKSLETKDYSTNISIPVQDDTIFLTPYDHIPTGAEVIINGKKFFKTGNTGTATHVLSAIPQWSHHSTECFITSDDIDDIPTPPLSWEKETGPWLVPPSGPTGGLNPTNWDGTAPCNQSLKLTVILTSDNNPSDSDNTIRHFLTAWRQAFTLNISRDDDWSEFVNAYARQFFYNPQAYIPDGSFTMSHSSCWWPRYGKFTKPDGRWIISYTWPHYDNSWKPRFNNKRYQIHFGLHGQNNVVLTKDQDGNKVGDTKAWFNSSTNVGMKAEIFWV